MCRSEIAPGRLHFFEGFKKRQIVMFQPARIVENHEAGPRQLRLDGEDLVDLLLVLGDDDRDLGMIEDIDQLGGDRVLVNGYGDATEGYCGELRPIEPRPVVADDGKQIAAAKSKRRQSQREIAHLTVVLGPRPGLPDAAVLLADCRPVRHRLGIAPEQPRQCGGGHSAASLCSAAVPR